mmetsp:Transcript_97074/g.302184  ORF Transcript_97074/g.302184 Transcript_97074/m.302184 type:complete len:249 (-) Transcript_97074:97-843(-)
MRYPGGRRRLPPRHPRTRRARAWRRPPRPWQPRAPGAPSRGAPPTPSSQTRSTPPAGPCTPGRSMPRARPTASKPGGGPARRGRGRRAAPAAAAAAAAAAAPPPPRTAAWPALRRGSRGGTSLAPAAQSSLPARSGPSGASCGGLPQWRWPPVWAPAPPAQPSPQRVPAQSAPPLTPRQHGASGARRTDPCSRPRGPVSGSARPCRQCRAPTRQGYSRRARGQGWRSAIGPGGVPPQYGRHGRLWTVP